MAKIGVVIGRFQVDELHSGHRNLINYVNKNNDELIIFIGVSPLKCTYNNPLDFSTVKKMLNEVYPEATIMHIKDESSDKSWSRKLDKVLKENTNSGDNICLYGSRDSFISHYYGKYKTERFEQTVHISGTSRRKEIANSVVNNADFRKGIIWATMHQYIGPATTIDVAILSNDETKVLLGKKPTEDKFRFIGGFAESGENFERTVYREALEETKVGLTNIHYITSSCIDDWRFKNEKKKITTLFFKANILGGKPIPGDDIAELAWADVDESLEYKVVDIHIPLVKELRAQLKICH